MWIRCKYIRETNHMEIYLYFGKRVRERVRAGGWYENEVWNNAGEVALSGIRVVANRMEGCSLSFSLWKEARVWGWVSTMISIRQPSILFETGNWQIDADPSAGDVASLACLCVRARAYVRPSVSTLRAALRAFKLRIRVKNSFSTTLVQQNCFYISCSV